MKYLDQDKKNEILHVCHSEGAINTKNALGRIPKSYRDRINVLGIASPVFIPKESAKSVIQYESKRDPFAVLDRENYLKNYEHVIFLKPHPDAKTIDHEFISPTYKTKINYHIKEFINNE